MGAARHLLRLWHLGLVLALAFALAAPAPPPPSTPPAQPPASTTSTGAFTAVVPPTSANMSGTGSGGGPPAGTTCPGVGSYSSSSSGGGGGGGGGGAGGSEVATLARRFAPVLVFSDKAQGYPTIAQDYYAAGCAAQVCSRDDWLPRPFDPCAHVYYAATWCPAEEGEGEGNGGNSSARQLRIRYHVFYPWQAPCTELAVGAASEHQSDWEGITVFLSLDKTRVAAVAYGQHGGWYTRVAGRDGFEEEDGRPVVYVGRYSHGCYHDTQSSLGGSGSSSGNAAAAAAAQGTGGAGSDAAGGGDVVQQQQQQQQAQEGQGQDGSGGGGGGWLGSLVDAVVDSVEDAGRAVAGLVSEGAEAVSGAVGTAAGAVEGGVNAAEGAAEEGVGAAACAYFGDPRGGGLRWNTGDTVLVDLQAPVPAEPWIAATLAAPDQRIFWEAGQHIDFGVNRWAPPCNMTACRGRGWDVTALANIGMEDAGCSRSQCPTGWKESGLAGCFRCPPGGGYTDCGLGHCAKGDGAAACLNPLADRVAYETTGYDYVVPDSDEGLL